ncbi:major facilitator superfamily domain-containing protein [Lipomyces oligophaga]|uniref:major facilitator superfamily domain-containing protein n=1 Tax=Lipomyces oligophaga TaxID=45792 RepID=UPI0034CE2AD4
MDVIAATVEDEAAMYLSEDDQIAIAEPFHQRPRSDIDSVVKKNGGTTVVVQPYTDDPNGPQVPLIQEERLILQVNPKIFKLLVPFMLFAIAFGGSIAPKINVALTLICREHFVNEGDPLEANHQSFFALEEHEDIDPRCQIPIIHQRTSSLTLWVSIITGLIGAITTTILGKASDRVGRRPILLIATLGPLLSDITILTAGKSSYLKSYNFLYLASVFDGLSGSFIGVVAMCHSYATDITKPGTERAAAFSLFHGTLFVGVAVGPMISSYLVSMTGSVVQFFYVGITLQIIFILLAAFFVPESRRPVTQSAVRTEEQTGTETESQLAVKPERTSILAHFNIFKSLAAFNPKDGTKRVIRHNLIRLAIMDSLVVGNALAETNVMILYSEYTFKWSSIESGYYLSVIGITRMIILFVIAPALMARVKEYVNAKKKLQGTYIPDSKLYGASRPDMLVLAGSALIGMIAQLFYFATNSPGFFYVCASLNNLSGACAAVTEATISKHVPRRNTGKILGAVGMTHSIARIVVPSVYLKIYSWTIDFFPKAIFLIYFGAFMSAFFMALGLQVDVEGGLMEDGSDVVEDGDGNHLPGHEEVSTETTGHTSTMEEQEPLLSPTAPGSRVSTEQ